MRFAILFGLSIGAFADAAAAQPPEPRPPAVTSPPGAAQPQEPGFLGLLADDRTTGGRGVAIIKIDRDGPADKAGLKEGDLIVGIGGQAVRTMADMGRVMSRSPAGTKLEFHVQRAGAERKSTVILGQRPPRGERTREFGRQEAELPSPTAPSDAPAELPQPAVPPRELAVQPRAMLGVRTVDVTAADRLRQVIPPGQGAVIAGLTFGSPAHEAGLPLGGVIMAIDGKPISGPLDLARHISSKDPGDEIEVSYNYRGEQHRRRIVLADSESAPRVVGDAGPSPPTAAAPHESVESLRSEVESLKKRVADLEKALDALKKQ
jgi:predicted metalloprotease with PDZ domain